MRERQSERDRERERERETKRENQKFGQTAKVLCRSDKTMYEAIEYDMIVSYSILQNAV